ncbi:hypothetical protein MHYP_G00281200 [Metynnis hypsauchen]
MCPAPQRLLGSWQRLLTSNESPVKPVMKRRVTTGAAWHLERLRGGWGKDPGHVMEVCSGQGADRTLLPGFCHVLLAEQTEKVQGRFLTQSCSNLSEEVRYSSIKARQIKETQRTGSS